MYVLRCFLRKAQKECGGLFAFEANLEKRAGGCTGLSRLNKLHCSVKVLREIGEKL